MTTHVDATRKKLADRGSIPLISTIQTLENEEKRGCLKMILKSEKEATLFYFIVSLTKGPLYYFVEFYYEVYLNYKQELKVKTLLLHFSYF